MSICEYDHGSCTAPDTLCPHWIGTFCELDEEYGCQGEVFNDIEGNPRRNDK